MATWISIAILGDRFYSSTIDVLGVEIDHVKVHRESANVEETVVRRKRSSTKNTQNDEKERER